MPTKESAAAAGSFNNMPRSRSASTSTWSGGGARARAAAPPSVAGLLAVQPFFGARGTDGVRAVARPHAVLGARAAGVAVARIPALDTTRDHATTNVPTTLQRDAGDGWWRAFPATFVCVGVWYMHQDRQRTYADALRLTTCEMTTTYGSTLVMRTTAATDPPPHERGGRCGGDRRCRTPQWRSERVAVQGPLRPQWRSRRDGIEKGA